MAAYPINFSLPYTVSKAWLEERILAGDLVEPRQEIKIEFDRLTETQRERALDIFFKVRTRGLLLEVMPSGISPQDGAYAYHDDEGESPLVVDPVVAKIGFVPELPAPTVDPDEIFDAYEAWIRRYCDLAGGAAAQWIESWAKDELPADGYDRDTGVSASSWLEQITWRVGQRHRSCEVDGRKSLELYLRAHAAQLLRKYAMESVDDEDSAAALGIIGRVVELERAPISWEDLVAAFEDYAERLARLAFARYWIRLRARETFDLEMNRWVHACGSERLRMGLEDGYRMIAVYLRERLDEELPGFYAWLPKENEPTVWQARTGPTAEALAMRRAVQDKLAEHTPEGIEVSEARIGWVKNVPDAICDAGRRTVYDSWGDGETRNDSFEVIVVPDWMGRYALIAAVDSPEVPAPDYVLNEYVLQPDRYGLPAPPVRRQSVPVDISDFAAVPPSASSDDDIPF